MWIDVSVSISLCVSVAVSFESIRPTVGFILVSMILSLSLLITRSSSDSF